MLTEKQKTNIRQIIRQEYGTKEYSTEEYDKIIMDITDKVKCQKTDLVEFLKDYVVESKNKIKLVARKNRQKKSPSAIEPMIIDDEITDDKIIRLNAQVEKLRNIISPKQGTKEWYEIRHTRLTASDTGCVMGINHFEKPYKFIVKKLTDIPFETNEACYHGKKYEKIAMMLYEYIYDVQVAEFGLICHPSIAFIGASPDGIVFRDKNGKMIGRMVEIKCPLRREIKIPNGTNNSQVCPVYYGAQVQLQLECCDLDECDFWQCKITEYDNYEDFSNDTNPEETYLSVSTGMLKGCLLQILPNNIEKENSYEYNIYNYSKHIYPESIKMELKDIKNWTENTKLPDNYHLDKIIYWKFEKTSCLTIARDKTWFNEAIETIGYMWKAVEHFRLNADDCKIFNDKLEIYRNYGYPEYKINRKIMNIVDIILNKKDRPDYLREIEEIDEYRPETTPQFDASEYLFD